MTAATTRPAGYGCPRCDHTEMANGDTPAATDAAIDATHRHLMRTHVWARSTAYRLLTELRPLTAREGN